VVSDCRLEKITVLPLKPTEQCGVGALAATGRLGHNNTVALSSPVQIGALTTWSQIARAEKSHSLAIKTDGTMWSWGLGGSGQLGLGDAVYRSSPVQIGALTTWSQIAGWS
jgi:alpha-tubulin suppressor-like RCC1 family protein